MTDNLTQLRAELRAGIPYAGETDSGGEVYDFDAAETTMALAADALDALQAERDSWRRVAERLEGEKQAAEPERDEARARVTALEKELAEALDGWAEAAQYKGDYFREKHGDMEEIERLRALLNPSKGSAGDAD